MSITGAGAGGLHEARAVGSPSDRAAAPETNETAEAAASAVVRDGSALRLENGVGSAALRARVEAALPPEAAPELGPIDLDAVRGGMARFDWPLRAGRHRIDVGGDEPLIVDVKSDTTLHLEGKIVAGDHGPRLTGVQLRFSREVSLANPGALIEENWEEFADAFVDVNVRGIGAGPDGKLHIDGEIDGPFGLDRDLDGLIGAGDRPDASFDLKRLLGAADPDRQAPAVDDAAAAGSGAARAPAASPPSSAAPAATASSGSQGALDGLRPDRLLEGLGPVIEPGRFELRLESEQNTLVLGDRSVVIAGAEPGAMRVEVRGTADVDDAGRFVIGAQGRLESAVADAELRLDARIGLGADGEPRGSLRSDLRVDVKDADVLDMQRGMRLRTHGEASEQELRAETTVRWTEAGRIAEGRLRAELDARLAARGEIGELSGTVEAETLLRADLRMEQRPGAELEVRGPVHAELRPDAGEATLAGQGPRRPPVPLRIRSANSVIVGDMEIEARGSEVRVRDGSIDLNVALGVDRSFLAARDGRLVFDGQVLTAGRARVGFDPESGLRLDTGELSVRLGIEEGRIRERDLELELGPGSSLTAAVTDVTLGPAGLRVGGSRSSFEFRLAGERARINDLELALDPDRTSVIEGETDLFTLTEAGRLEERGAGRARLRFDLHGRAAALRNDDDIRFGARPKHLRGEATLEIRPDRVRVLDGHLSAELDLGGTEIDR